MVLQRNLVLIVIIMAFQMSLFAQKTEPVFTFACLSDSHAQGGMINSSNVSNIRLRSSFINSIDKIRETEKIDALVLGGDYSSDATISEASWKKVRELMATHTINAFPSDAARTPVIYAVGNHDFEVANHDRLPKGYVAGDFYSYPMRSQTGFLTSDECFYEMAANALQDSVKLLAAYHYQIGGFDFVVHNCGKYFFKDAWDYRDSQTSCEWVAAKLDEIDPKGNKTIFYINHLPLPGSRGTTTNKTLLDNNATQILTRALAKHPGVVYLYGHDHSSITKMSYITDSVSQRVTEYDNNGKIINDSNLVSTCFIKGINTNKYITGGSTINPTARGYSWTLVSGGTSRPGHFAFKDDSGYYIFCGTTNRFSTNKESGNEAYKYGYIYEIISDTTVAKITDISNIKYGKNYLYIAHSAKDSTLYAMKTSYYSGNTGPSYYGLSANTKQASDTLHIKVNTSIQWTLEKNWSMSFKSCFMGSMRYNDLNTNESPGTSEPQIVQALIVRVYNDSIVLDMKNYGQTGHLQYTAVSPTIADPIKPYVLRRTTQKADLLTYTVNIAGSDEGAIIFDGNVYRNGDTFTVNSTVSEEQLTAKSVGSLYTKTTLATGNIINLAYSVEQPTIDYSVRSNLADGSVIYKGIHYRNGETITVTTEIEKSELTADDVSGYEPGEIHLKEQSIEVDYFEKLFDPETAYVIALKNVPDNTYGAYLDITGSAAPHALRSTTPIDNYIAYQAKGYYYINARQNMSGSYLGAWTWNATKSADPVCWTITKVDDSYVFYQKEATYIGYLGIDANDVNFYCNKSATKFIIEPSSSATGIDNLADEPSGKKKNGKFFDGKQIIIIQDSKKYNISGIKEK